MPIVFGRCAAGELFAWEQNCSDGWTRYTAWWFCYFLKNSWTGLYHTIWSWSICNWESFSSVRRNLKKDPYFSGGIQSIVRLKNCLTFPLRTSFIPVYLTPYSQMDACTSGLLLCWCVPVLWQQWRSFHFVSIIYGSLGQIAFYLTACWCSSKREDKGQTLIYSFIFLSWPCVYLGLFRYLKNSNRWTGRAKRG